MLLVLGKEPERYRNLRRVEELRRHCDDTVHKVSVDNVFADFTFTAGLRGKRTICKHHANTTIRCEMPDHVLQPCKVGVASRRRTILPTDVINEFIRAPAGKIERRIRHNIIRFELRVTIVKERVRIKLAEVSFNTTNSKIHLSHLPCGRVGVLTKDGNLVDVAAVIFDEFCRLNEHTTRAAARVINTSIKRLQHLNKGTHNTRGSIELTSKFAFLFGKL